MSDTLGFEQFWNNLNFIDSSAVRSNQEFLRPENRSSTIFPVYKSSSIITTIQFLAYWLKKHGNNVIVCLTSRSVEGEELDKKYEIITEYKAYTIQISDSFSDVENGFCGSLEVEVYSKKKPLYTFPAITVCYEGNGSSSLVHSCIRTYNQDEIVSDYAIMYPQTGFDTFIGNLTRNYLCFFGGKSSNYKLRIELVEANCSKSYDLDITNISYGQMHVIWLEDLIGSSDIGLFKSPKCSIHHDLKDVFPRFYVGILNDGLPPTLTHTFFDTSKAEEVVNSNTWSLRASNQDNESCYDCAFSVPIFPSASFDTALRTYGQNLSFSGDAFLTIYTMQGEDVFSRSLSQAEIVNLCGFGNFDLSEILNSINLESDQYYCLKLAFVNKDLPFPKRFKLGLNVKRKAQDIGTNICFAPLVVSESILSKPFNRRWFPVGGLRGYVATVHNTSLVKRALSTGTESEFEFINHHGEALLRRINVKSNGSVLLDVAQDNELNDFLGKDGGWCMVTSKSCLTDSYYFSLMDKQIGGDHAY